MQFLDHGKRQPPFAVQDFVDAAGFSDGRSDVFRRLAIQPLARHVSFQQHPHIARVGNPL